jgi:hypothetical protein
MASNPEQWRYVQTDVNPADLASRGFTASGLMDNYMWWTGPEYLHNSEASYTNSE